MKARLFAASLFVLAAVSIAFAAEKLNVVYHVSEAEKVPFVLNNMQNHIDGVGGPEQIHLVLVAHGPAINALTDVEATDQVRHAVESLRKEGVEFDMCGNTLKGANLTIDELLPGFVEAKQGGVTRIGELESQGYLYIRPDALIAQVVRTASSRCCTQRIRELNGAFPPSGGAKQPMASLHRTLANASSAPSSPPRPRRPGRAHGSVTSCLIAMTRAGGSGPPSWKDQAPACARSAS